MNRISTVDTGEISTVKKFRVRGAWAGGGAGGGGNGSAFRIN